jgi:sulfoxide reductase heme-binding subunit YedZ
MSAAIIVPPSPLWFFARASGFVSILLLTVSVCAGLLLPSGRRRGRLPFFVVDETHRFAALVFFTFLAMHVATTLLDPFTRFRLTEVLVPFASDYRRVWLGLGVAAAELALAVALSVHLRPRLGYRTWRAVHYATYALFPLAVLHGMGTGTDTASPTGLVTYAVCAAAVLACASRRLRVALGAHPGARLPVAAGVVVATASTALWAVRGPLAPGWSHTAGTPNRSGVTVTVEQPAPPVVHR